MPSTNQQFGTRLKHLLDELGWKQVDLARRLEVTKTTVSRYIQGRVPDADTLGRIAKIFNVSTDYLLGRDEPHQQIAVGLLDDSRPFVTLHDFEQRKLIEPEITEEMKVVRMVLDAGYHKAAVVLGAAVLESYLKKLAEAFSVEPDRPFSIHALARTLWATGIIDQGFVRHLSDLAELRNRTVHFFVGEHEVSEKEALGVLRTVDFVAEAIRRTQAPEQV